MATGKVAIAGATVRGSDKITAYDLSSLLREIFGASATAV